jgi:hypothetical protein
MAATQDMYKELHEIIDNTPINVSYEPEPPISDDDLATTTLPSNTLHIINPASDFVVVTYWWGRGNDNKNTARPCLDFYEQIVMLPFELASKFDADLSRVKLDWVKWLASHRAARDFYKEQAKKYEQDSKGKYSAEIVEKEILRFVLEALNASVTQTVNGTVTVKSHKRYLREIQKFGYRRLRLEEELKRGERPKEEILVEIKAIVQSYTQNISELKKSLREIVLKMEQKFQYVPPIKYHKMISKWKAACVAAKCNHMAIEYKEFAQPGGYQLAINAKPLFIKKALEVCGGGCVSKKSNANKTLNNVINNVVKTVGTLDKKFSVVYIDGDMTIDRYPKIFDIKDVDYMGRGWNIDPRGNEKHIAKSISVDPYVFETSGGIMYFAQTPEACGLLNEWINETKKPYQAGKADDRIISLVFNSKRLLAPMKIIQLPLEYLWLSMNYDDSIPEYEVDRERIYVSHPECLTSEDTAGASGASSDRTPKFYKALEDTLNRSEELYESVMFSSREMAEQFRPWLNYIGSATYFEDDGELEGESPFYVYKWGDFGKKTAILQKNIQLLKDTPNISTANNKSAKLIKMNETTFTIPNILRQFTLGHNIMYIPSTASPEYVKSLDNIIHTEKNDRLEFIYVDKNVTANPVYAFQYKIDLKEPMYIRTTSATEGPMANPALYYMFALMDDVSKIEKCLHDGYQFLSRIRCHSLKPAEGALNRHVGGGMRGNDTQDAYDVLYKDYKPQAGGRRRHTTRRRRSVRRRSTRKN